MKLFTIGPVQMYRHTLELRSQVVPYFRTPEFSEMMRETDRLLKTCVGTNQDSSVIYLTASGTAAMEATVVNCLNDQDNILVIDGGTFGRRFVEICQFYHLRHRVLTLPFGRALTNEDLSLYDGQGVTALLVNLHETSTGQLYDIKLLSEFCRRNGASLMVDAISTFLCDPYEMDKRGIDVTILSSQKGLCLSPGLSMVVLSAKMAERVQARKPSGSIYFDFLRYIEEIKRGQTPFTPAVGVLYELNDMLKVITQEGLGHRLATVSRNCRAFRKAIFAKGLAIPRYPLSDALTPIMFERDIAYEVFTFLKDRHSLFTNPTGGELGKRMLRVAHVGDHTVDDFVRLADLILDCVAALRTTA